MNVVGLVVMPQDVEVPEIVRTRRRPVGLMDRVAMHVDLQRLLRRHRVKKRRDADRGARPVPPRRELPPPIS